MNEQMTPEESRLAAHHAAVKKLAVALGCTEPPPRAKPQRGGQGGGQRIVETPRDQFDRPVPNEVVEFARLERRVRDELEGRVAHWRLRGKLSLTAAMALPCLSDRLDPFGPKKHALSDLISDLLANLPPPVTPDVTRTPDPRAKAYTAKLVGHGLDNRPLASMNRCGRLFTHGHAQTIPAAELSYAQRAELLNALGFDVVEELGEKAASSGYKVAPPAAPDGAPSALPVVACCVCGIKASRAKRANGEEFVDVAQWALVHPPRGTRDVVLAVCPDSICRGELEIRGPKHLEPLAPVAQKVFAEPSQLAGGIR